MSDVLEPLDVDTMTREEAEGVIRSMLYSWEHYVPFTLGIITYRWHFFDAMAEIAGLDVRLLASKKPPR